MWKWFFYVVLRVFFSEVEVIGAENIPEKGAVIFVGMFLWRLLVLAHSAFPITDVVNASRLKVITRTNSWYVLLPSITAKLLENRGIHRIFVGYCLYPDFCGGSASFTLLSASVLWAWLWLFLAPFPRNSRPGDPPSSKRG